MNKEQNAPLMALGLCKKAGKLICGTPMVCEAAASRKKPELAVMSTGASENTKKKLRDKCAYYGVRLVELDASPEDISRAIGGKASTAAVAISDAGLAGLFLAKIEKADNDNRNEG
jgi:ribosomal protein L7Ae-like RNA K-turn-binding protein